MVKVTKDQFEKENQELRDHVTELEAQLNRPRRSQSESNLRESVRLSTTPSAVLRRYPPSESRLLRYPHLLHHLESHLP
jgi:cell division septum initiation protein DivIVA